MNKLMKIYLLENCSFESLLKNEKLIFLNLSDY